MCRASPGARRSRGHRPFDVDEETGWLLALHAFYSRAEAVEAFAGGDEQGLPVGAAEADVGGPAFGHFDLFDLLSGLIEDGHAIAGEVEIALAVDGHAVGAER